MNRIASVFAMVCISVLIGTGPVHAHEESAQQTVLITGANRGIGFEFAKQYADKGYRVIATCRNPAKADDLNAFAKSNSNVIVERLDLIDLEGIDALAEKYAGQAVDVLVSNAAMLRGPDKEQTFGSMDFDWFDQWFHTNARGPLKVAEAFWPNLKASENGIIASLTTGKAARSIPILGFAYYKSSKAAVDDFFLDVARKGKKDKVRVITISPGRVATGGQPPTRAMVPIEESIGGMIKIFDEFTLQQNGKSYRYDGTETTLVEIAPQ